MYTQIQHEPKVLGVKTTSFASRHPLHAERVVVFLKASKHYGYLFSIGDMASRPKSGW